MSRGIPEQPLKRKAPGEGVKDAVQKRGFPPGRETRVFSRAVLECLAGQGFWSQRISPEVNGYFAEPVELSAQPVPVEAQPQQVLTQPQLVLVQPVTVSTQPLAVLTQPQEVLPQPVAVPMQPQQVLSLPLAVETQLLTVTRQPEAVLALAMTGAASSSRASPRAKRSMRGGGWLQRSSLPLPWYGSPRP